MTALMTLIPSPVWHRLHSNRFLWAGRGFSTSSINQWRATYPRRCHYNSRTSKHLVMGFFKSEAEHDVNDTEKINITAITIILEPLSLLDPHTWGNHNSHMNTTQRLLRVCWRKLEKRTYFSWISFSCFPSTVTKSSLAHRRIVGLL